MFRRSLFIGLTIMLAGVLIYLVIQGRRQERRPEATARPVEVVRSSPPSLTRVIQPADLSVVESRMNLVSSPPPRGEPAKGVTAVHHIVIRNSGSVAYHDFALRVDYFGKDRRAVETKTVSVSELLQPGQARSIPEFKVENVPAGTLRCEVRIRYADLEPAHSESVIPVTGAKGSE